MVSSFVSSSSRVSMIIKTSDLERALKIHAVGEDDLEIDGDWRHE
ncbi:unnamed protein product [Brassica rapa]|uniref:Uncharacterized protein n=1 Tax=Brassica campestris TaxID=3711 RepID=A0A8D9GVS8_BRACM|nr:unnamed protein product [Brassica rapa]